MTAPTRADTAGRAYLDLRNLARQRHRPVDELHQLYVLEAFLDRLTRSPFARTLVLKGGVLLAALGERRPTRDIDLQAQAIENDLETIRATACEIAARAPPSAARPAQQPARRLCGRQSGAMGDLATPPDARRPAARAILRDRLSGHRLRQPSHRRLNGGSHMEPGHRRMGMTHSFTTKAPHSRGFVTRPERFELPTFSSVRAHSALLLAL